LPHINDHAVARPSAIAIVDPTGKTLSWEMLNNASIEFAHILEEHGAQPGQIISILLENRMEYFIAVWGALRLGLYVTPINWHLKDTEVSHIASDSDSILIISSTMHSDLLATIPLPVLMVDQGVVANRLTKATETPGMLAAQFVQTEGQIMYYSSGTTGKPKGIRRPFMTREFGTAPPVDAFIANLYGISADTTYLSPAPLYHAAPLNWCLAILRLGGKIIFMDKFEPQEFLAQINNNCVTHTQVVPTMFVRLLKMPEEIRKQYDTSSLKVVVHAAAPCPREIKQQMIDWLGDVIYEYYGGSESNGVTALDSEEWRKHPGSVGRVVLGQVHICDEQGAELPPNQEGTVYFSGLPDFEYYKDPVKTRDAYNDKGWSTLGDIGYLDDDGYLYLTDRRAFMIVSGGVNIYPQEIENLLVNHPQIMDVAVLGMPNPDFGEEVVAVIEPTKAAPGDEPLSADSFTAAISAYCKANLAAFKCPKKIILMENLPRLPNGKLLKRMIKEQLLQRH